MNELESKKMEEAPQPQPKGKLSDAEVEALKAKYKDVFELKIENSYAYLRKLNRKEMGLATTIGVTDPMGFNESIIADCWLAGDENIKTDDDLFLAACGVLPALIESKVAELKKR